MKWQGVVFDLFGTLVPPFRKAEHTEAIRLASEVLGIEFEMCHKLWVDSFPQRTSGGFASVSENFSWIADQMNAEVSPGSCEQAALVYADFTQDSLVPLAGVVGTMAKIAESGLRIGLLTNCAPDVPVLFPETALGSVFTAAVFSSRSGVVKPSPESYKAILEGISTDPAKTLYVGDGSDGELSGAQLAGMRPVLVTPSLHNTYDRHRPEVASWTGTTISTIPEVLRILDED